MLLVAAGASSALTLGRAQGVALIGRPLDMGIQMTLDAPGDTGDLCTEAEVFYGDNRVDARRVDLSTSTNGAAANLRVRVSLPVDEAFVQVYLRVGCNAKFTRRYVLLSEQPADVAEAAAVPTPSAPVVAQVLPPASGATRPAAVSAPDATSATAGSAAPVPSAAPTSMAAAAAPAAPIKAAPRPAAKPPVARVAPPPAAVAVERPRLKLDALEVRPQAGAATAAARGASAAAAAASAAAAAETAAAAAQELERNAQRMQALDEDLRKLREGMLRSDAALVELRARLEKAEGERYANGLVFTLAGLLLAAVAAAFAFWRRSRSAAQPSAWWDESRQRGVADAADGGDDALYEESQLPAATKAAGAANVAAGLTDVPAPQRSAPVDAASAPGADGKADGRSVARLGTGITGFGFLSSNPSARSESPTETDGLRVSDPLPLSSDELSDIQQEADFFVSLGEYDRAIEILRNHIEAHPQASAVAWLDLLEIHHKLGQRDEYEQLRRDFEWLFNAKAPSFEAFNESRDGIEAHPRLVSRIQAAWPRREVLETIDEAIFRRPGAEGDEPLNLEGYRDLLFLHALASELSADDAVPVPAPASAVAAAGAAGAATADPVDLATLDINLDELLRAAGDGDGYRDVAAPAAKPADSHLMDFDTDLGTPFKLPAQRPPQG